jgi:glycosyltransferase involved in cell wall biosynthesis
MIVLGLEDEFTNVDIKAWAPLRPAVFQSFFTRSFGYAAGYGKYLAETSPDIAHVHGLWTYPSLAGYLWHRRTKRPLMYTAHGMLDPWALRNAHWKKRLVRALWEDAAHRSAACFHAISEGEYENMREYGLRNPICVIPNGADPPRAVESLELRVESSPFESVAQGRKVLLYLGRLHPKKNLVNLIRGWKAALNSQSSTIDSWVLAIAGWDQGGYKDELEKLASDLGLLMTVAFVGPQFDADKDACYRACNAFVLPSFSEGLPMTVLEAWAHAKPVLMTPECNLPEGFAAGAALRVGTEATDIAKSLTQLFEMVESDRKEMGARGRALVGEKFSWPRIGEQMRAVYEWALGGGAPPDTVRLN